MCLPLPSTDIHAGRASRRCFQPGLCPTAKGRFLHPLSVLLMGRGTSVAGVASGTWLRATQLWCGIVPVTEPNKVEPGERLPPPHDTDPNIAQHQHPGFRCCCGGSGSCVGCVSSCASAASRVVSAGETGHCEAVPLLYQLQVCVVRQGYGVRLLCQLQVCVVRQGHGVAAVLLMQCRMVQQGWRHESDSAQTQSLRVLLMTCW
jgi:hypothetical protein